MKYIEHHCLVWSGNRWRRPSGGKPYSESEDAPYSTQNGFGHEEWNGGSLLKKGALRGFYTQAGTEEVRELSKSDRLCIVMTSREPGRGRTKLIGVAVDVRVEDDDSDVEWNLDTDQLMRDLLEHEDIWKRHGDTKIETRRELLGHIKGFGPVWSCAEADFWWADEDVWIRDGVVATASGAGLTRRYAQSQPLAGPTDILGLLPDDAPERIKEWLRVGDFSVRTGKRFPSMPPAKPSKMIWDNTGESSAADYIRYITSRLITVRARHTDLQKEFFGFADRLGFRGDLRPRYRLVDLVGEHRQRGRTFIEIKPAETETDARFGIRLAIGQLLEYCWLECQETGKAVGARLIVLGCKPPEEAVAFAKSLGVGCAWRIGSGQFVIAWP